MKILFAKEPKKNKPIEEMVLYISGDSIDGFYNNRIIRFSSILELSHFIRKEKFVVEARLYE